MSVAFCCADCGGQTFLKNQRFQINYGQYPNTVALSAVGPFYVCVSCGAGWTAEGYEEAESKLIRDYLSYLNEPS